MVLVTKRFERRPMRAHMHTHTRRKYFYCVPRNVLHWTDKKCASCMDIDTVETVKEV